MAKKSKKKNTQAKIDINETLIDNMSVASAQPASDEEDDEFEQLLNSFINSDSVETSENSDILADTLPVKDINASPSIREQIASLELGGDETELAQAYANFLDAVTAIALMRDILLPSFIFRPEMLAPNYKPSTGKKIVGDASLCWDVLLQAFPEKLSTLNPNASDEEFLNFAESLADQNLQLAIISYVEILIDIENCEISYEEKRLRAQRRRIERELYEEYQRRLERKRKFVEAVQQKQFPIDADRLISNYFKTAAKDAEGAYEALTKNPAVYAPIETQKIKPRFFGLIKVSPKDGIRENQRLGRFLKYLKV